MTPSSGFGYYPRRLGPGLVTGAANDDPAAPFNGREAIGLDIVKSKRERTSGGAPRTAVRTAPRAPYRSPRPATE